MKFEVHKPVFLDALQMACNAIPSKTTLQILYINLVWTTALVMFIMDVPISI